MVIDPVAGVQDSLLENPDLIIFVHGSYAKNAGGKYQAGYAVTTQYEQQKGEPFPSLCAQPAGLWALTWAHQLAKGKGVTIYTNSSYVSGGL